MKFLLIVSLSFTTMLTTAQQISIGGTVKGGAGTAIPGANVLVRGAIQGAVTDFDGNYVLNSVKPDDMIIFSYTGYIAQEITVGNQSQINVQIKEDLQQLEEVVIIGYGEVKRSDLTGAISSVNMDGIEEVGAANINQVLEGRTTGVQIVNNIGTPGDETDIVIRGRSSISTSSAPLFVVDGILLDESVPTSDFAILVNPLQTIAPEDIEFVQVLKDASATAISRGANGVILITMKGDQSGKAKMFLSHSVDSTRVLRDVDVLSPQEIAANKSWQAQLDAGVAVPTARFYEEEGKGNIDPNYITYYNWQDIMLWEAIRQTYRVGISGGKDGDAFLTKNLLWPIPANEINNNTSVTFANQNPVINCMNLIIYAC